MLPLQSLHSLTCQQSECDHPHCADWVWDHDRKKKNKWRLAQVPTPKQAPKRRAGKDPVELEPAAKRRAGKDPAELESAAKRRAWR